MFLPNCSATSGHSTPVLARAGCSTLFYFANCLGSSGVFVPTNKFVWFNYLRELFKRRDTSRGILFLIRFSENPKLWGTYISRVSQMVFKRIGIFIAFAVIITFVGQFFIK